MAYGGMGYTVLPSRTVPCDELGTIWRYAVLGTDVAFVAMKFSVLTLRMVPGASQRRDEPACYHSTAVQVRFMECNSGQSSGTIPYAPPMRCPVAGLAVLTRARTDPCVQVWDIQQQVVSAYAPATECPVLAYHMNLRELYWRSM
eukprot:2290460-Rhodomonas_salina.2